MAPLGTGLEHLPEAPASPSFPEDVTCQWWPDTQTASPCLSPCVLSPLWLSMTCSGAGALPCLLVSTSLMSLSLIFFS